MIDTDSPDVTGVQASGRRTQSRRREERPLPADTAVARRRGRKPKGAVPSGDSPGVGHRYFLTKAGSNGIPELDREFPAENDVLVEALKQGRSFVMVSEWQAAVEIREGSPFIGKRPLRSPNE